LEKMRDHMLTDIEIGEEHAFLCEVPGWNNQTYLDTVEIMRKAEPVASPRTMSGGAARSPGSATRSPAAGHISGGMARARITEMVDSD
jgi:hypothetical protein